MSKYQVTSDMNNNDDFQKLHLWQKAHEYTLEIYKITSKFPKSELFSLTSQLRRAAYSIPSNIAEGFGRKTTKDFLNFLIIARGSIQEVRYYLILCHDLIFLSSDVKNELEQKYQQLKVSLNAFIKSLSIE